MQEIKQPTGWTTTDEKQFLRRLANARNLRALVGYIFSAKHFERRWGRINRIDCLRTAEELLAEARKEPGLHGGRAESEAGGEIDV